MIVSVFLAILLCGSAWSASVGWQPPRELAFSPEAPDRLAAPSVYSEGDHVMVVYQKRDMWFIESRDGGKTWSEPVSISKGPVLNRSGLVSGGDLSGVSRDWRPTIVGDRANLLVAWHGFDQGNYRLFLARRKRGSTAWETPTLLVDPGRDSHAFCPRFVLTPQGVYVFWYTVINAPGPLGATTPLLTPGVFINPNVEGPASINIDANFRDVGKDTRKTSIGIHFGMLNVSNQVQPQRVRNPESDLRIPTFFEAYTDQFGNLYCAMTENLQIVTRKYSPTIKTWAIDYSQHFDNNYFITAHYLGNRLQLARVETRPTKVVVEVVRTPGAPPERASDPIDLDSIPSFWVDGDLTHVVWSRNESDSSWIAYARSDHTPPTSRFTKPAGRDLALISESPFWINWEGSDDFSPPAGLMYRYRFTDGNWSEYRRIDGIRIVAPPDRPTPYQVELQAVDEAANVQTTPAALKFDVSGVAPETLITQGRQEIVVRRQHTLAWIGQDNTDGPAALQYSYNLDDQPPSDFKGQTTVTLQNLKEGGHDFQVRARDRKDNLDPTPAVFHFTVSLGIECFFPAAPPVITNQNSYTLKWDCRDETPDVVQFSYRHQLDGGDWSEPAPVPQFTFANLSEGQHTVAIRAVDPIGNTSKKDLPHTFTVDLTPPATAPIDRLVLNQKFEPIIQLSGVDNFTPPTRLLYRYSFDNSTWQPTPERELLVVSGKPVRFWSLGYKVYVTSVDEAGNPDPTPAVVDFTFLGRDPIAAYAFLGGVALLVLAILGMMVARMRPRRPSVVLTEEELFPSEKPYGETDTTTGGAPAKKPDDDLFS